MTSLSIKTTAFRGEHGAAHPGAPLQTRLGCISFGSLEAARTYALSPNNARDTVLCPRVIRAEITINNPLLNDPSDPFIDIGLLVNALGHARARQIALSAAHQVADTQNWLDIVDENSYSGIDPAADVRLFLNTNPEGLYRLYLNAYHVLDNPIWVRWLAQAGFDGACHGGNGVTACEAEYKIFKPEQARIISIVPLDPARERDLEALDASPQAHWGARACDRSEVFCISLCA